MFFPKSLKIIAVKDLIHNVTVQIQSLNSNVILVEEWYLKNLYHNSPTYTTNLHHTTHHQSIIILLHFIYKGKKSL